MTDPDTEVVDADGLITVDLTDRELYRGGFPHELFVRLRQHGPVLRHPSVVLPASPDGLSFWCVIGHPEVQRVDRDWERFSTEQGPSLSLMGNAGLPPMLPSIDPPAHTRLRRLINSGFTPRMVAQLGDLAEARIDRALDRVFEEGGVCDFVHDVALQVPMHMIADIVGIPEADRGLVFGATETMWRAGDPEAGISKAALMKAQADLYGYARRLGEEKRAHPTDDVWSTLTTAEIVLEDGERTTLQPGELDRFFMILTLAGSETTTNAISQGLVALLENPDQLAALRADPSLLDSAIDEILRWTCPVTIFGRVATEDLVLGGAEIHKGERVTMWYPSANFDERVFDEPFRFDVRRKPNPHVSFGGGGAHYCMGANLAKLEMKTVYARLLERCQEIEITGPLEWGVGSLDQNGASSLVRMPVRLA